MTKIDKEYYNKVSEQQGYHYTQHMKWFPLMMLVLDRLKGQSIVDLGCGAGHFAHLLHDQGYQLYTGIDYSEGMLEQCARRLLPYSFKFINLDLMLEPWVAAVEEEFDTVVAMELIEHLPGDIEVLQQIPAGTHCLLTTTNEPGIEHVRTFLTEDAVAMRYGHLFSDYTILSFKNMYIPKFRMFQVFYLVDGIRGSE